MVQIFVSHTKYDESFCDRFDRVIAREPIGAFRSEFEDFGVPAWRTIKEAMEESCAMFLLVGEELVKRQNFVNGDADIIRNWRHTQNWISYEIGLACQLNIDVWVLCDDVHINFPVPYLNNYHIKGLKDSGDFRWLRTKLKSYLQGGSYPYGFKREYRFACPHSSCGSEFNLHTLLNPEDMIICPSCLREIRVSEGKSTSLTRYLDELKKNHKI